MRQGYGYAGRRWSGHRNKIFRKRVKRYLKHGRWHESLRDACYLDPIQRDNFIRAVEAPGIFVGDTMYIPMVVDREEI